MAKRKKKEKVSEIFEVEKNGKKKIIKTSGTIEENENPSENQIKKENKIFKNVIIILGIFLIGFFIFYNVTNSILNFEVQGVKFQMVQEGNLMLYKTSIPGIIENGTFIPGIYKTGEKAEYNFYFRKDPRELEKNIDFSGEIVLKGYMVLNMTEDLANVSNCEGDSNIAIANLAQLYTMVIGTKIMTDENATCDDNGRYTFLKIEGGDETGIAEYGLSGGCYNIKIRDCEILEGTEKFMLETLIYINKQLYH